MILDRSAKHDTSEGGERAAVSHVWRSLRLTYCTLSFDFLLFASSTCNIPAVCYAADLE